MCGLCLDISGSYSEYGKEDFIGFLGVFNMMWLRKIILFDLDS